jgi:hypothetical protein
MRTTVIAILIALIVIYSAAELGSAMPTPLGPDEQEIAGYRLKLQPPDGYCLLEAGQTEDARAIEATQQKLASTSRVIFSYADCSERARSRQGERQALLTVGSVVIGQNDGKPKVMPTINRRDYLAILAQPDNKTGGIDSHTKILTESNLPPTDENAQYIGGSGYVLGDDQHYRQLAYINAFTEINSIPVAIGFSHPLDHDYSVADLYKFQSRYVAKLISMNESNEDENLTNTGGVLTYKAPLTLADVILPLSFTSLIAIFIFWRPKQKTYPGVPGNGPK